MESWQELRMKRAHEQSLVVNHLGTSDDSFIFSVQGLSGEYIIEIHEDVNVWPPRCDCDDNYWRPDLLCKHYLSARADGCGRAETGRLLLGTAAG